MSKNLHLPSFSGIQLTSPCITLQGPLNTYARAGKLFPGPHLYAGAGLVCLWALAVACVPQMQKGNDVARTVHIGANIVGIGELTTLSARMLPRASLTLVFVPIISLFRASPRNVLMATSIRNPNLAQSLGVDKMAIVESIHARNSRP
jgi:hypothetical protein